MWKGNAGLPLGTYGDGETIPSLPLSCLPLLPCPCCSSLCSTFQVAEVSSSSHFCSVPHWLLYRQALLVFISQGALFCSLLVCLFVFLTVVLGRDGSLRCWRAGPEILRGEVQVLTQPVSQDELTFAVSNFYHESPELPHFSDWLTLPPPYLSSNNRIY